MKLVLPVPVRKVSGPTWHSFEYEPREVEVVYLTRRRWHQNGWQYQAAFDHPDAHPEAVRIGYGELLLAWVRRADHPRWKPPMFPEGVNVVKIQQGGAA